MVSHCATVPPHTPFPLPEHAIDGLLAVHRHVVITLAGIATGPLTGSLRSPSTLPWASSPSVSPVPSHQHPSDYTYMPARYTIQQHEESLQADGDVGWKLYCTASFTTAMAVVMAELTRQVEVQCSERAHALALAWNLYSAAMDTCLGQHGSQAKSLHNTGGRPQSMGLIHTCTATLLQTAHLRHVALLPSVLSNLTANSPAVFLLMLVA